MSNLLKFARLRDDREFVWRVAAAMSIRAQEIEAWDLDANQRALVEWVLNNPLTTPYAMLNQLAINPGILAQVSMEAGVIDASAVPDDDIQYVVNDRWITVAAAMFGKVRGNQTAAPLIVPA
jgi:hypothetical protein